MPAWTAVPMAAAFCLFAIGGLDPGDSLRDGCQYELRVPGPWAGEELEHGGLKVPTLFLRIPGSQSRLGDDV